MHILARVHHDDGLLLLGDLHEVGAREHVALVGSGVLGAAEKALQRRGERRMNVGVERLLGVEAQIHGLAKHLRSNAAAHRTRRLADDALETLEHLWQAFQLEAAGQLDAVLAGVPPLHGREVDARRLGRDTTLFDERTHEAHAEPLLLELRPKRRIGIKGPISLRAHGLLTEGEPRLDAGVGAPPFAVPRSLVKGFVDEGVERVPRPRGARVGAPFATTDTAGEIRFGFPRPLHALFVGIDDSWLEEALGRDEDEVVRRHQRPLVDD